MAFTAMPVPNFTPSSDALIAAATAATGNAYAPYSNFRVGAAVLLEDGRTFSGCNVENISYGLTNCAERTAIFRAIAETPGGAIRIRALAVVNFAGLPCSPCGACRQVIAEFSSPDTTVFYRGANGFVAMPMKELLPESFHL
ncbi:MAG: cytidine deaminase [Acidobacteriaceae bacterium]